MLAKKKVAFHTLGCKLNFTETSTIARSFVENGYELTDFSNKADFYVINTCSVTDNADKKFKNILNKANKNNPDAFNMLGFSNRKLGNNDEAFSYYNKALDLDPEHLGTHEYIGRLYLNLEQLEESKKHFRILKALCYFGCEELKSLEKAIKEYEMEVVTKKY